MTEQKNRIKSPTVSIGMPVYNGAKYIREALDSLLAQSFTDFELIISDNCSTDNTLEICKEYALKDSRVTYFQQKENIGSTGNFAYVLENSKAEIFMWAAHDDEWHPEYLNLTVRLLDADETLGFVMTKYQVVSRKFPILFARIGIPNFNFINNESRERRVSEFSSMPFSSHKDNMVYALWRTVAIKKVIYDLSSINKTLIGSSMNEYALSLYKGEFLNKLLFFKKYSVITPGHFLVRLKVTMFKLFCSKNNNKKIGYTLEEHLSDLKVVLELAEFDSEFIKRIVKINKKNG